MKIVDRKKELIINAAGKNMSPANIEAHIKSSTALIGQAIAIGGGCRANLAPSEGFKTILVMSQNFLECDREQVFLMPPDPRGWLSEGHVAWFVLACRWRRWISQRSMALIAPTVGVGRRLSPR